MEWFMVGAGVSAAGSLWGAETAAEQMEAQANIATWQGIIAQDQARFAARMQLKAGREQAGFIRRESARRTGAMTRGVAESGVELAGSPALVIAEQIRRDEHAAATVITNSRMRAYQEEARGRAAAVGAQVRHDALLDQAGITRTGGYLDAIASGMKAAGAYYALTGSSRKYAPAGTIYDAYDSMLLD